VGGSCRGCGGGADQEGGAGRSAHSSVGVQVDGSASAAACLTQVGERCRWLWWGQAAHWQEDMCVCWEVSAQLAVFSVLRLLQQLQGTGRR
jgi:hypothetical protein